MPGQDGKLTAEDRQKIAAWLARFPTGADSACPMCGSTTWMIAEHLVQPITVGPGGNAFFGGVSYPQVMMISNPCGYTRTVNAVVMGVVVVPPIPPIPEQSS